MTESKDNTLRVEVLSPVNHDQVDYDPGDVIEMQERQAHQLVQAGFAKLTKKDVGKAKTVDEAQATAKTIVDEAQAKADQLIKDAQEQADRIKRDADSDAQKARDEATADINKQKEAGLAEVQKNQANQVGQNGKTGQEELKAVPKKQN